ncbi:hypothetical protein F5X96DRAFT_387567 [Biscogniauxia mediterranea]|nr:hypothetical protein F5X96DRAFT_387567 [Biscogniauxia mediterranea]
MSGSGGFFRYRCKYFYTHNCPNWVYVNNTPCANCCAEGREVEGTVTGTPAWTYSEICVPYVEDGIIYYTLMEIVSTGEPGNNFWTLRYKVNQQCQAPAVTTTSATPGAPIIATSRH